MKYYVVSDVHGFYDELIFALTKKGFFDEKSPHKLIICGDLLDRGEKPTQVQEFILDLIQKDLVVLVRGNHEDLALEFVENVSKYMTPTLMLTHHYRNGTVDSMLALTGTSLTEAYNDPLAFAKKCKQTPFFTQIIPKTVDFYETENYVFLHGWMPCGKDYQSVKNGAFTPEENWRTASPDSWEIARWVNGMQAWAQGFREPKKTVVCGHVRASYGHAVIEGRGAERGETADYTPFYGDGILAIDGCAVRSKKINCIVIED